MPHNHVHFVTQKCEFKKKNSSNVPTWYVNAMWLPNCDRFLYACSCVIKWDANDNWMLFIFRVELLLTDDVRAGSTDWLIDSDWLASDASIMTHSVVIVITMAIPRCAVVCGCGGFYKKKIVVCHQPALIASAMMTTVCSLTAIRPWRSYTHVLATILVSTCTYVRACVMRQAHRL